MLLSTFKLTPLYEDVFNRCPHTRVDEVVEALLNLINTKGFEFMQDDEGMLDFGDEHSPIRVNRPLRQAFRWADTAQGHDFWSNINSGY